MKGAQVSLTIRGDDGDMFRPIQGVSGALCGSGSLSLHSAGCYTMSCRQIGVMAMQSIHCVLFDEPICFILDDKINLYCKK